MAEVTSCTGGKQQDHRQFKFKLEPNHVIDLWSQAAPVHYVRQDKIPEKYSLDTKLLYYSNSRTSVWDLVSSSGEIADCKHLTSSFPSKHVGKLTKGPL